MELTQQNCQAYEKGSSPLSADKAKSLLTQISNWQANSEFTEISRSYQFKNYYQTIAFVNALAWVCHQEDHHPDLAVSYNRCNVTFSTHSVGGLSTNDFICAAKLDTLTTAPTEDDT